MGQELGESDATSMPTSLSHTLDMGHSVNSLHGPKFCSRPKGLLVYGHSMVLDRKGDPAFKSKRSEMLWLNNVIS